MMGLYFAQDELVDRFKIGKAKDIQKRMKTHRTSNPGFKILATYQTADPKACEAFLKSYLAQYRISGTDEFFSSDASIDDALLALKHFEGLSLPKIVKVNYLAKIASDGTQLSPSSTDMNLYFQVRALRDERTRLDLEIVDKENELKIHIGEADGIEGVATWKTGKRGGFDFKTFERENREFVECHSDVFGKYRKKTFFRKFLLQ